jgi:hypothetical protein
VTLETTTTQRTTTIYLPADLVWEPRDAARRDAEAQSIRGPLRTHLTSSPANGRPRAVPG